MATASGEHSVSALEPSLPYALSSAPPSRGGCSGRHRALRRRGTRRRLSSLLVSTCSFHVVPGPLHWLDQSVESRVAHCVVRGSVDRGVRWWASVWGRGV